MLFIWIGDMKPPAPGGVSTPFRGARPLPTCRRFRLLLTALALPLAACTRQGPGPDRVFVSDEKANVVHVLDGRSGTIEGELRTGARPRGMALSPDGRTLFVACGNANRIERWDPHSLRHLGDIPGLSDPERIALGPGGRMLYVADEDSNTVSFVDLASGAVTRRVAVGPEPEGIGATPDGRLVVATSEVASVAHLIDAASGRILMNLPVGSRPRDLLFRSGGRELWVSSEQRGTISVFTLPDGQRRRVFDLVADLPDMATVQAVELKQTRDEARVFLALGRGNAVAELDPATGAVRRTFPTGERTWGIGLSPDETRLYAASGLSGDLTIVDLAANKVLRRVKLGGKPWTALAVAR